MSLNKIIKIIIDENLAKHWEIDRDEKKLCIYFKHYNITLLYDNGILYFILNIILNLTHEQEEIIQKTMTDISKEVFFEKNNIYIQSQYKKLPEITIKNFIKDILLEQNDMYNDIQYYIKNYNTKKNIFIYPHLNINNLNINNYPL